MAEGNVKSAEITDEVQQIINEVLKSKNMKDIKMDVSHAIPKGENYMGDLYRVKVEDKTQKKVMNFIVKYASTIKEVREIKSVKRIYDREINAYKRILPVFYNIQEKHNIPVKEKFSFGKNYGCIEEDGKEAIVIEDLSFKGFKMNNRKISLDKQHIEIVIKALAQFHATSFVLRQIDPELFEELSKLVLAEAGYGNDLENFLSIAQPKCISKLEDPEVQKRADERTRNINEKLNWFLSSERTKPYNVICHGDCWTNNLLFKYENDCVKQVKLIDLQNTRLASPIADLAYFIFSCTDEQVRSHCYESTLNLYYETLDANITQMGYKTSECYPIEVYRDHVKSTMPMGMIVAIFLLPVTMSEKENTIDKETSAEDFANHTIEKLLTKNVTERLNGVARDCVKYGYI